MNFIHQVASDSSTFADWGHDLLWCFYTISATAKNPKLRQMAHEFGYERALEWRRIHPAVPPGITADDLANLAFGSDAADRLGAPSPAMKEQIRQAAARYSVIDFLQFDPAREPPPSYDVWSDALITTYTGDTYGVTLGAPYRDVIRWISVMRPYPPRSALASAQAFYDVTYAITHVIYTLNDYNTYRLSPSGLPQEYQYLKANLEEAIKLEDPETVGEFLDTLRAFGMTEADPLIQTGVAYVLSKQNPDGSWGDEGATVYDRYHSTWTAVDGLRQYAYRGTRTKFGKFEHTPGLLPKALNPYTPAGVSPNFPAVPISYPHGLRAQSFHPGGPETRRWRNRGVSAASGISE